MFFNERVIELYCSLETDNLYHLSKKTGFAYSHCHKLLNDFARDGLVVLNKSGRSYNLLFTPKGKLLQQFLLKVLSDYQNNFED